MAIRIDLPLKAYFLLVGPAICVTAIAGELFAKAKNPAHHVGIARALKFFWVVACAVTTFIQCASAGASAVGYMIGAGGPAH
jgi:hypothetical protein